MFQSASKGDLVIKLRGSLLLLSTRPAVTFPAAEHYRPLSSIKLYCLVKEALLLCDQVAHSRYVKVKLAEVKPASL